MKNCNNCKYLSDTGDIVSVCEYDYTDLNSDFLGVEQSCPNHKYCIDACSPIRFELVE